MLVAHFQSHSTFSSLMDSISMPCSTFPEQVLQKSETVKWEGCVFKASVLRAPTGIAKVKMTFLSVMIMPVSKYPYLKLFYFSHSS